MPVKGDAGPPASAEVVGGACLLPGRARERHCHRHACIALHNTFVAGPNCLVEALHPACQAAICQKLLSSPPQPPLFWLPPSAPLRLSLSRHKPPYSHRRLNFHPSTPSLPPQPVCSPPFPSLSLQFPFPATLSCFAFPGRAVMASTCISPCKAAVPQFAANWQICPLIVQEAWKCRCAESVVRNSYIWHFV